MGRKHLGIETQQKYTDYAVDQLNQIVVQEHKLGKSDNAVFNL